MEKMFAGNVGDGGTGEDVRIADHNESTAVLLKVLAQ
jgi:hypothetical protein